MRLADINLSSFDTYILDLFNRAAELAGDNYGWLRLFMIRNGELSRLQDREGQINLINMLRSEMVRRYGNAGRTDPYEGQFQMRPRKTKKSVRKTKKSVRKTKKSVRKSKKSAK